MNQDVPYSKPDLKYQTFCLISGQLLFMLTSFFWTADGRYTANASTLMFFSMLLWSLGFVGLFTQIKHSMPIYSRMGLLYALYGTFGGVVFSMEGIIEQALEISKIGVKAAETYPMQMNLIMFQSGPAFPISLVILGIVFAVKRKTHWFTGIFLSLSGLLFPVGRITRSLLLAHLTDVLLLAAVCLLSYELYKRNTSAGESR